MKKIIHRNYIYEAVQDPTEAKILSAVKGAKAFDASKPIKLYRVGGVVRDEVLGAKSKDVDYLVANVAFHDLKTALEQIADKLVTTDVGESMHVIKAVIDGSEEPYDFVIPRTEVYGGSGSHDDLTAFGDPSLSLEDDLARRDLTFNAIAKDVETGEYVDPFGGLDDLKNKKIKAVRDPKERFNEDALRMIRVVQFANRFGFDIEEETLKAIQNNVTLADVIKGERILEELKKAFVKGKYESNENIVKLLEATGLGTHIFGESFKPIAVKKIVGDKFIVNMMLIFAHGGDFTKLKPSVEVATAITLGRKFLTEDALATMFKFRVFMPYIEGMVLSIGDSTLLGKLKSLEGVPLSAKELNIDSGWLMSVGYQGKALGDVQKRLIQAIYEKKVANSEPELRTLVEV